jgi:thiamine monophosphate kinase
VAGGRALSDDGVGDGDLVGDLTGLLDAGSNGADQGGLLAVTGEVGQGRAAIGSQSTDETVERAAGNIRKLSVGQTGSNEGNQSGGELHFDD